MTFRLNQKSVSAEGREIRRERGVEGERLTIGRAPTNDVQLTDLAVALKHAVVQRTGPLRLSVQAEEGLGVELNGRKVTSGFIELAGGGELRIASHLLRFLPQPADTQDIQIDVERVGESAADELDRIDVRRFSVGSVLPSKRISAYVLIALVLGIFLAWPLWVYLQREPVDGRAVMAAQRNEDGSGVAAAQPAGFSPDSMWSSGALSQVHHGLEQQCSACHVNAFEPVQDTACQTCHANVEHHGDTSRPPAEAFSRYLRSAPLLVGWAKFEQNVAMAFGKSPGRCVDCHTEHEGPQEMPVTAQRFCADCHTDLNARLPDTRIGNASDFGRAHPQFSPLVLIDWNGEQPRTQRIDLNRNPSENGNLKFPHDLHLNPGGAVTQMTRRLGDRYQGRQQLGCADCHTPTEDGTRFQPVDMEADCAACHTLAFTEENGLYRTLRHGEPAQVVADLREYYRGRGPARPAELGTTTRRRPGDIAQVRTALQYARARAGAGAVASQAIAAVFREGGACADCHVIDQRGPLDFHVRPVGSQSRFLLHGWFDHRAHVSMTLQGQTANGDQACLTCHTATRSNQASNLMIPGLESCQRCHVGENSNQQVVGQRVESSCAMCHDYHMDEGVPAMILRQRVRGQRWETTVVPVAEQGAGPPRAR